MSKPIVTINTPTFKGNKLSFTGTINFQGDTGAAVYYLDPLPSGTALGPFALPVSNGAFSITSIKLARGVWQVRVVATATAGDIQQTSSNVLTSNRGIGQVIMPLPNNGVPTPQAVVTPVLDTELQTAFTTAVSSAPAGSKRSTGATALVTSMGSKQTLQILRNGQEVIHVEYANQMAASLAETGITLQTGNPEVVTVNSAVDFSSGKWEYALLGGTNLSAEMRGTVGLAGSNADIILPNGLEPGDTFNAKFIINVTGVYDPIMGSNVITMDQSLQLAYTSAIVTAPSGAKRMAGANAIVAALRPAHYLNIYRNGELIIPVEYLGDCAVYDDGVNVTVSLGVITSAIPAKNADIASGVWTFSIVGGNSPTALISGSVGAEGSGASLILSESPTQGRAFDSTVALTIPRSADGLS